MVLICSSIAETGHAAPLSEYDGTVLNDVFAEANGPCRSMKPRGMNLAGAGLVLGAVAGGILGAAVGGSGRAIAAGAAALGTTGMAAGIAASSKPHFGQIIRHDEVVCKFIIDEAHQLQDVENGMVSSQPPGCDVHSADVTANPGAALSLMLQCSNGATSSGLGAGIQRIAALNAATCGQIRRTFAMTGTPRTAPGVLAIFASYKDVASCVQNPSTQSAPTPTPQLTSVPFEQTLAGLSAYTYETGRTAELPSIDGYTFFGPANVGRDSFVAMVFHKGHRYVVAFRGTEINAGPKQAVDTLIADAPWGAQQIRLFLAKVSPEPLMLVRDEAFLIAFSSTVLEDRARPTLGSMLRQAANGLMNIRLKINATDPRAQIYLTGHSLGGALALMLGSITKLPAVGFDAPGVLKVLEGIEQDNSAAMAPVQDALARLRQTPFNNTGSTLNYRVLGDFVSKVGVQVGAICTVFEPVDQLTLLQLHSIDYMGSLLGTPGNPRADGIADDRATFTSQRPCAAVPE